MDPAAGPSRIGRLAGLDGLRALAVTGVLLFHLFPALLPGGFLGVDVFFVISGFLITTLLVREHTASGRRGIDAASLARFWVRRARRLLPALAVVVLVSGAVALLIGGDSLLGLGWQIVGAATFSYNWLALADGTSYFEQGTPELFRILWSLAVEEQFYLLWPLALPFLLLVRSRGIRIGVLAALAAASAAAMIVLAPGTGDPTRVYFGTDTHAFGLLLGAALAVFRELWPAPPAWSLRLRFWASTLALGSLAGLVVLALTMTEDAPWTYRGGLALVALLSAGVIAGGVVPGSWLGRALDAPPLRWVGERSYGIYLWHWPVFVLLDDALADSGWSSWVIGCAATVLAVGAAAASYRWVELPVRRLGFRGAAARSVAAFRGSRAGAIRGSAVVAATLAAVLLTAVAVAHDPGRGEAEQQIAAGRDALDSAAETPDEPAPLPGGDQITAVGDSVMLAVAPALQEAFPGIAVDAVVSRQMRQAPELLQAMEDAGTLRPIVVLGLGTNGSFERDTVERVLDIIGDRQLVLVNVQAPRGWTDGNNALLARIAQERRTVDLCNWQAAIAPHLDLLAKDHIHADGPGGGEVYVEALTASLQRLAEVPPMLRTNDYGLAPRPS
ncbi:peptidoglycan/LPS O-acetylase OafA/YrhL [Diaminobutyricimonas aerilata]|uniref:Peptidoglycan/LPS O-acetylase OafA/YrhL n=2 Tax=Diaminobutyricimonas aerilata TaxID=1162967 RepID=A0A2M9CMT9_9MICO|nr:peptidoglycan/LPS O-acetylase OafA/YrhL [Diaminobutyricimonas aerilata]